MPDRACRMDGFGLTLVPSAKTEPAIFDFPQSSAKSLSGAAAVPGILELGITSEGLLSRR